MPEWNRHNRISHIPGSSRVDGTEAEKRNDIGGNGEGKSPGKDPESPETDFEQLRRRGSLGHSHIRQGPEAGDDGPGKDGFQEFYDKTEKIVLQIRGESEMDPEHRAGIKRRMAYPSPDWRYSGNGLEESYTGHLADRDGKGQDPRRSDIHGRRIPEAGVISGQEQERHKRPEDVQLLDIQKSGKADKGDEGPEEKSDHEERKMEGSEDPEGILS